MNKILDFIDTTLIPYVFIVSKAPILFHDLLDANRQLQENILPAPGLLGFKPHTKNIFISFLFFVHIFFIFPALGILHELFVKTDCHLSIIAAVVFTGLFFIGYSIYREFLTERIAKKRVIEGWSLHFPHFSYDEYGKKVADIYNEAIKKKVSRGELEFFVMSRITH